MKKNKNYSNKKEFKQNNKKDWAKLLNQMKNFNKYLKAIKKTKV